VVEDKNSFGWALIGPGAIAGRFASALPHVPSATLRKVHGRDPGRSAAFVAAHPDARGVSPQVARDLADLLDDPSVDAVYVATPHARHGEFVRRCLAAGKPVLCEKPLVPTLADGASVVELAARHNVFLMEAVWTRFLPVYQVVADWLRRGLIGPVSTVRSSFCFEAPYDPEGRLFNPALAGGALLDLGVYNVSMTRWVIQQLTGTCPEPASIEASASFAPTGVDQWVSASLGFPGGLRSEFECGLDRASGNGMEILGEDGLITVPSRFWEATAARLHRAHEPPDTVQAPFRGNGFEYEIEEAQRCIRAGLLESPRMTHADSMAALRWMDEIRRVIGLRYPFE
jgi:predicted dehydrogenase